MKFEFTADHDALRGLVSDICAGESAARTVYDADTLIDSRLWNALSTSGLLGVGAPEAYEGGGAGPVEQSLIAEALGRAVGAVPFSEHTTATEVIAAFGSDDQRKRLLIPLTRGEAVGGIVLPEPNNLAAIEARSDGARWRITGRLPLIPNAASATVLVVPVLIDGAVRWLFTDSAPLTPLPTVDRTRPAAAAEFSDIDAELLCAAENSGHPGHLLRTLAAAEAAGVAATVLERTAQYTTERLQFGLRIGTFQAVKHRLADMLVAVENSRSAVYGAAWALAEGAPADRAVALAQAVATGSAITVVGDAIQLHGGIGVTWECDLHLYLRRAKALEVTYGSPAHHRTRIADSLLID